MSLNGTLPSRGAGRQPVFSRERVFDVRTANQRVALVERLTSTTVGIVIDEPNRRFWVEFDRERELRSFRSSIRIFAWSNAGQRDCTLTPAGCCNTCERFVLARRREGIRSPPSKRLW